MDIKDLVGLKEEIILASDSETRLRLTLNIEILETHLYYLYKVTVGDDIVYEGDGLSDAIEIFNTKERCINSR